MDSNATRPVCQDPAALAAALMAVAPTTAISAVLSPLAVPAEPDRDRSGGADAGAVLDPRDTQAALNRARNAATDPDELTRLASHPDSSVVRAAAENPSTPLEVVEQLHQQMLVSNLDEASCTINRLGAVRWLTDARALGIGVPKRAVTRLVSYVRTPEGAHEADQLIALATDPQVPALGDLRRQLAHAASGPHPLPLPALDSLSSTHRADYLTGMLQNTIEWNDQAADWFAAAAPLADPDDLPTTRIQGMLRVLTDHQVATLKASPCPLSYAMLLSSAGAHEHLTDEIVTAIFDTGLSKLRLELLFCAPARCTTEQLATAIRSVNLSNLKTGDILRLETCAGLPDDVLLKLLEHASKLTWAYWLAGHLPAQPTQAIVDQALNLQRFTPGNGLPNVTAQRAAMARQVADDLVEVAGNQPVPDVATTVLEWLGARLLNLATTSDTGSGRTLYARTLAAWATRELGEDPQAWSTLVRLSGTLSGSAVDLDTLAMVVRASLEQHAPNVA